MLATESSSLMIIVIGLDRLLNVLFPFWYCVFVSLFSVCGEKSTPLGILEALGPKIYGCTPTIVSFNNPHFD